MTPVNFMLSWIVLVSERAIHCSERSLDKFVIDSNDAETSEYELRLQNFQLSTCIKCSELGAECGCDSRHRLPLFETLQHYASSYGSLRSSIANFEYDLLRSRWLIVSASYCECYYQLISMINALQLAVQLNFSVVIHSDHSGAAACKCEEEMVSVVPFVTTDYLEHHDLYIGAEHEIDLHLELDCLMSTDCITYLHQWSTVLLKNAGYDVLAIGPMFPQAQLFEEYVGINFLIFSHFVWSGHGFDTFVPEFPCLSSILESDNPTLPRVLGSCIRQNALLHRSTSRANDGNVTAQFWYCHPCLPNQSWPWEHRSPFVTSFQYFPSMETHVKSRQSQRLAVDSYFTHFKQQLYSAPHKCGNICEQCTVTKGLFFLARELTSCFHSSQGYNAILNTWRWLQGSELNFHDFFQRNSPAKSFIPLRCKVCEDLDKGLLKIWDTAQALRLIYTLNPEFEIQVENLLPSDLRKDSWILNRDSGRCVIGVHVRRGDSCIDTIGASSQKRECYPTSKYFNLALDYQTENPECRTLFISSDDATAVLEIRRMSEGSFTVLAANVRREKYAVNSSMGCEALIEKRAFQEPSLNRHEVITEAIADVVGLSRCDVIIGHLGESVFSQTALLLNFAHSGVIPPFATINFPMCYYWHYWGERSHFLNITISAFDCL